MRLWERSANYEKGFIDHYQDLFHLVIFYVVIFIHKSCFSVSQ